MDNLETNVVENNNSENSISDKDIEEKLMVDTTEKEDVNSDKSVDEPEQQTNNVEDEKTTDVPQAEEDVEHLKKQLEEYRLRDEEIRQLSERLGTDKFQDTQLFEANKQLDILDNQAQQAYINLCNQFNVDYRPDKIEASANELKEKDPKAYYDLNYRLGQLDAAVNNQRMQIMEFIRQREINIAKNKYNQILAASPALTQQLKNYLNSTQTSTPMKDIDIFINMAQAIQKEAFEYGKLYAQQEQNNKPINPADVLNNNSIVQNGVGTSSGMKPLTMSEIEKMDLATYSKYAAQIDKLRLEGKL